MPDNVTLVAATVENSAATEQEGDAVHALEVGQWYWVKDGKDKRWFGCIVHVGSNFATLESPAGGTQRIHFDEFLGTCTLEPQPDAVIQRHICRHQEEVRALLAEVKTVTAALAIGQSPLLGAGETQALAVRGKDRPDMKEYGSALVKAKEQTLPELFKKIRHANESLAEWMTAEVVPLKAQASQLNKIIGHINDRIFSVELYAGLVETIERIKDGQPAPIATKIHLLQRRCYMDEECLARYETGGMEFEDIHAFDAWLARPDNFKRLLPFPRSIVAFQVRRNDKLREVVNLIDIQINLDKRDADRWTFLYIRNGEQLFRLSTAIQFDKELFPDLDRSQLSGKLWAEMFAGKVDKLITNDEHSSIIEEALRQKKECEQRARAYNEALKSPEAKAKAKAKGLKHPDASCVDVPYAVGWFHDSALEESRYQPYDKSNVYYDDISKHVGDEIKKHNRIALLVQGLLDRSPVLHPHPPWQIWSEDGFRSALELVYDESRALTAGDKPDFLAYQRRLNASLKVGSITVGQQDAWELYEGGKESERRDRDYRHRREHYRPTRFRPSGNPGPGMLAALVSHSKHGKCTFAWNRERQTHPYGEHIRTTFTCNAEKLLHVDAYTPGDFRQFFDDPRTRAEYLQWAPLLLEAEEYHAGNRKVQKPPPPEPKKESSWEGQRRYEQRKRRLATIGKAVRLVSPIETKGGNKYDIGSLWRVTAGEGGKFNIAGIKKNGTASKDGRYVRSVSYHDFVIDPTIPDEA